MLAASGFAPCAKATHQAQPLFGPSFLHALASRSTRITTAAIENPMINQSESGVPLEIEAVPPSFNKSTKHRHGVPTCLGDGASSGVWRNAIALSKSLSCSRVASCGPD